MNRALATSLACLMAVSAYGETQRVHWNELSPLITNHSVTLQLPDGTRLRGKAIAVEPEQLVIDVRKTSNRGAHPAGRQNIARSMATSLDVSRPTKRWRIIGTVVGAAVGVPVGALVAIAKDGLFPLNISNGGNGGTAVGIAVIAGLTAGGFLLGWAADRRTTSLIVVPDTASPR